MEVIVCGNCGVYERVGDVVDIVERLVVIEYVFGYLVGRVVN